MGEWGNRRSGNRRSRNGGMGECDIEGRIGKLLVVKFHNYI